MPTRTRKSGGKKAAGKQTASESLSLASCVHFAPPFAGYGPFGGQWSRYPVSPTVTPCPGFWGAVRHYPTVGGIVAQLGANAGTGRAYCTMHVYYQFDFTAQVPGVQTFVSTLNVGTVTRLPRGGSVYAWGLLQLTGPGGPWAMLNPDLPSNTGVSLSISPKLQVGGRYRLTCGVVPVVYNAGYQSYCEIIVKSATLDEYLPYGVQSAEALRPDAGIDQDTLMALLNPGKKEVARKTSLAEAIKMGTTEGL